MYDVCYSADENPIHPITINTCNLLFWTILFICRTKKKQIKKQQKINVKTKSRLLPDSILINNITETRDNSFLFCYNYSSFDLLTLKILFQFTYSTKTCGHFRF